MTDFYKQLREKLGRRSDKRKAANLAKHRRDTAGRGQHLKIVKPTDKGDK